MHKLLIRPITLFILCFSTQLIAHPHHNEAVAIAHHGIIHTVGEGSLFLLIAIVVGFILIKVFKYFNETNSSNK